MSHLRAFKLIEKDLRAGCREIQVEGELDLAVAEQLAQALERARSAGGMILVGLGKCDFIDSTGIAAIVQAHNRFAEEGVRVVICAPSDQVLRVLSITGLTANGLVFENVEEALAQIGSAQGA
jgi:anti-sigma B factor antagonist